MSDIVKLKKRRPDFLKKIPQLFEENRERPRIFVFDKSAGLDPGVYKAIRSEELFIFQNQRRST